MSWNKMGKQLKSYMYKICEDICDCTYHGEKKRNNIHPISKLQEMDNFFKIFLCFFKYST